MLAEVKLTAFQKRQQQTLEKIFEYKLSAEASAVALIYKNPSLLDTCDLTLDDLSNNIWKCGYAIAKGIRSEGKQTLTDIDVGQYLDKHNKLKAKMEEYGGYDTLYNAGKYVEEENFDAFCQEIHKWNCVIQLLRFGFPVSEKLSEYADMSAEQIYQELDGYMGHIFANSGTEIKSYDALDDLHETIDEMNAGTEVGMPINAQLLNAEIGGIQNGNIYSISAASGVGKTTILISYIFPSAIKYNRKLVMFINEEDVKRVRKDLLIWVCSNILLKPIQKITLRDGGFDEETLKTLHEAADWLESKNQEHLLTIIPLAHYECNTVIKLIHKYRNLFGVDLFILDTFKESSNAQEESWKSMLHDSVRLYDCIKPAGLNVALVMSMQLSKSSMRNRHLTNADIGQSKSVVDVFSVSLFVRRAEPDEMEGEQRELRCFRLDGVNRRSKVPFSLNPDKYYFIWFVGKNRFGRTDVVSIVTESDLSINKFQDIGYTVVPEFNG